MSQEKRAGGPHQRQEPRFPGPLTLEGLEQVFAGCSDFAKRTALLHDDPQRQVTLCYINGMVRGRINGVVRGVIRGTVDGDVDLNVISGSAGEAQDESQDEEAEKDES